MAAITNYRSTGVTNVAPQTPTTVVSCPTSVAGYILHNIIISTRGSSLDYCNLQVVKANGTVLEVAQKLEINVANPTEVNNINLEPGDSLRVTFTFNNGDVFVSFMELQ